MTATKKNRTGAVRAAFFVGLLLTIFLSIRMSGSAFAKTVDYTAVLDGQYHTYNMEQENDVHNFVITIKKAGYIHFDLQILETNKSGQTLLMELYEESTGISKINSYSASNVNVPVSMWTSLSPGTYRLTIIGNYSWHYYGRYRIRITYTDYGVNNHETDGQYNPTVIAKNQEITGAFTYQDTMDWYQFTVPADNTNIHFYFNSFGADISEFYLRKTNGEKIKTLGASSYGSLTQNYMNEYKHTLAKGTYLIQLCGRRGGKYILSWKIDGETTPAATSTPASASSSKPSTTSSNEQTRTPASSGASAGTQVIVQNITYIVNNNKTVTVTQIENKNASTVTIPDAVTINNVSYPVTEIRANTITNNRKVKQVTIGANVTKIQNKAFYNCKNLKVVKVRSKNLKKIAKKAFWKCGKKITLRVPREKLNAYKKLVKKAGLAKKIRVKAL